ncbi:hypothetical protein CGLO_13757 [Colletotrichum gloeosporioides Cg-14]|uniref:Uncharacterized protein n=1 Tax=Colletotrichum gloeosporioides (strain Cg-14) TaxID=1237896 RepID=T0LFU2_COLGC|nr:hypothetical protein CGLO_13757 [Colletotrichum gloeosporioides Cg-14]
MRGFAIPSSLLNKRTDCTMVTLGSAVFFTEGLERSHSSDEIMLKSWLRSPAPNFKH